MKRMRRTIPYWLLLWLDRRYGWCWTNTVSWWLGHDGYVLRQGMPPTCRLEAEKLGSCYCGKVRHTRDEAGE